MPAKAGLNIYAKKGGKQSAKVERLTPTGRFETK